MADEWEMLFGLDPTNADDRNFDPDGDGYTNLEEFLNSTLPVSTADFDFDGDVDANDFTTWKNAFGNSPAGDTDGDGADLLAWQRQFTGNLNPLERSSTIPEPPAVIMLFVGLNLCLIGRHGAERGTPTYFSTSTRKARSATNSSVALALGGQFPATNFPRRG